MWMTPSWGSGVRPARERKQMSVTFVSTFLVLGVRLAFSKAQPGSDLTWIGVQFRVLPWELVLSIPSEHLQVLDQLITDMLLHNDVILKDIHAFAGERS